MIETLDIHDNISSNDLSNITFENPVKEIIWVFRHNDRVASGSTTNIPEFNNIGNNTNPNDIFNYSHHSSTATGLGYGTFDTFRTLTLSIGNQERFSSTEATFFRTMQPYKHHSNTPGGINQNEKKKYIYVYSFSLSPEDYQPSGSYNFSALDDRTAFSFTGHDLTNHQLTIFTTRYEYVSITRGRVSVTDVPIQQATAAASSTGDGSGQTSLDASVQRRSVRRNQPQRRWAGQAGL